MTSEKAIEANRKNALKSTGPKSEEGKKITSQNALTHGLTGGSLFNPRIDKEIEFQEFTKKIFKEFDPQDELQLFFVNRITSSMWRLKRVVNIEEFLFNKEIDINSSNIAGELFEYIKTKISVIQRYETSLERSLFKTLKELQKLKSNDL